MLGLAALRAGAREVVLLDAAPEVAALARRNSLRNAVEHGREALVASRSWKEDLSDLGTFDVVFACDLLYPIAESATEETPNVTPESAGAELGW